MTARAGCLSAIVESGVCAILDDGLLSLSQVRRAAHRLARGGIRVFQLRVKLAGDRRFLDAARSLVRDLGNCWVLINDRADIARLSGAAGVHLGSEDLPVGEARRLLGKGRVVGVSAGNMDEVRLAVKSSPDYISVGPVFRTLTKRNAGRPLGAPAVRALIRGVRRGIVRLAVGGITSDNVVRLADTGINAVAAASALSGQPDPARAAGRMLEAIASAGIVSSGENNRRIGGG